MRGRFRGQWYNFGTKATDLVSSDRSSTFLQIGERLLEADEPSEADIEAFVRETKEIVEDAIKPVPLPNTSSGRALARRRFAGGVANGLIWEGASQELRDAMFVFEPDTLRWRLSMLDFSIDAEQWRRHARDCHHVAEVARAAHTALANPALDAMLSPLSGAANARRLAQRGYTADDLERARALLRDAAALTAAEAKRADESADAARVDEGAVNEMHDLALAELVEAFVAAGWKVAAVARVIEASSNDWQEPPCPVFASGNVAAKIRQRLSRMRRRL